MKKPNKISFEMSEISDISNNLVIVNRDFYTRQVTKHQSSIRFPIPKELVYNLDLKAGDKCYFIRYSEGFLISFKVKPEDFTKKQVRERKLIKAGAYDTLYLVIPPFIKNLYLKPITNVQLAHTKGFREYEWQFAPLFTDYTYENN